MGAQPFAYARRSAKGGLVPPRKARGWSATRWGSLRQQ